MGVPPEVEDLAIKAAQDNCKITAIGYTMSGLQH
jgi:hypothetical protein